MARGLPSPARLTLVLLGASLASSSAPAAAPAVRGAQRTSAEDLSSALAAKWSPLSWLTDSGHVDTVPKTANISIEIYYGATCPRCLNFLSASVAPLVESKLPGDQVQLTMLPWVPRKHQPAHCEIERKCAFALPSICALPVDKMPAPADSEVMRKASRFAICELQHTAMGSVLGYTLQTESLCAKQAGLAWEGRGGLQKCARGDEATQILNGTVYQKKMKAADRRLLLVKGQPAPFVFLNGNVLVCPTSDWCEAVRTPDGDTPLEKPGSLLYVVCQLLDSPPEVCKDVKAPPKPKLPKVKAEACENCAEVGRFRWRSRATSAWQGQPLLLLALAGLAAASGLLVLRAGLRLVSVYSRLSSAADAELPEQLMLAEPCVE